MADFPKPLKNLWNNWDIRVFVLISLLLQMLLVLFASWRRRKASKLFALSIWSIYLLADWAAAFALGLLSNVQGGRPDCDSGDGGGNKLSVYSAASSKGRNPLSEYNNKLLAFWAPFLLLHLGGPDTITAFAMEDNELWPRHLLGLLFELGAAAYIFMLSIPKNNLLAPTILVFVAGSIKYLERTYALYLASLDGFRDSILPKADPGPNYAKLMEEYASKKDSGVPAYIKISEEPPDPAPTDAEKSSKDEEIKSDVKKVQVAHELFDKFKGLIVELIFSFHERNMSMKKFIKWSAEEAFKVVEFELGFLYDVLFTKAAVIHNRRAYILRAVCSGSIAAAFVTFYRTKKHGFHKIDIAITYTLLGGAIGLDALAFVMLVLSDWTVVKLKLPMLEPLLSLIVKAPPRNRWSVSVTQHNLINFCLPKKPSYFRRIADRPTFSGKMDEMLGIGKVLRPMSLNSIMLDELQYTHCETVTDELKEFIFSELKKKAEITGNAKEARTMCSCRGGWALEQSGYLHKFGDSVEVELDESLLRWHIATDLCYYTDNDQDMGKEKNQASEEVTASIPAPGKEDKKDRSSEKETRAIPILVLERRKFSKLLSDYMAYLLVMRPFMMSSAAVIGQRRYQDTCAEAKNFFIRRLGDENGKKDKEEERKEACNHLISVNTEVKPLDVKGDRSKSVVFDACILAKKLKELNEGKRWIIMSEVWMEMLAYTASRCPGIAHAQRLSKGGELLTFVWFLMTHLGLGEQYRIEAGHARAQLIVEN